MANAQKSFNSPRVLLEHDYSCRAGSVNLRFNSPRVLLERGIRDDLRSVVECFNSPRVLLELELTEKFKRKETIEVSILPESYWNV